MSSRAAPILLLPGLVLGCAEATGNPGLTTAPTAPVAPAASSSESADVAPATAEAITARKKKLPPPTLRGAVSGRPFVAVSALMTTVNRPMRACSSKLTGTGGCSTDTDGFDIQVSSIRIYERAVTCADVVVAGQRREVRENPGERWIEVEIQGHWPLAARSTWKIDQAGPDDPRNDHVQTATFRVAGAQTSSLGYGEARFTSATATDGTLDVNLTAMRNADANNAHGEVSFAVCPAR